jgi:hypothetical protein
MYASPASLILLDLITPIIVLREMPESAYLLVGSPMPDRFLREMPDKERYPGLPCCGFDMGLTAPRRKTSIVSKTRKREGHGPINGPKSHTIIIIIIIIIIVIPIIIGAIGTITKLLRKYLSNIPGKHDIKQVQTTAILDTAHVLWEVLMYKYRTFNMGNNITCSINCNYRIAVKLCTLETLFDSDM